MPSEFSFDLAGCGPFCERALPELVLILLLVGSGSLKTADSEGNVAADGFVSGRPTMNVATR
jgi:hypothetical protein